MTQNAHEWAKQYQDILLPAFANRIRTLSSDTTMQEVWATCTEPKWMLQALHLVGHKSWPGPRQFAVDCVVHGLEQMEAATGDKRRASVVTLLKRAQELCRTGVAPDRDCHEWAEKFRRALASDLDHYGIVLVASALLPCAHEAAYEACRRVAYPIGIADYGIRAWVANRLRHYVPKWSQENS